MKCGYCIFTWWNGGADDVSQCISWHHCRHVMFVCLFVFKQIIKTFFSLLTTRLQQQNFLSSLDGNGPTLAPSTSPSPPPPKKPRRQRQEDESKDIRELQRDVLILQKEKLILEKEKLQMEKEKLRIEKENLLLERHRLISSSHVLLPMMS